MQSVLITGGAGFFGRGFARAALDAGAERVCIYSRGEYQQHLMRVEFGDDPRLRFFIGDIRDRERLEVAMEGVDLVVHAAALKRIEVGHYNPTEMFKTNIDGTVKKDAAGSPIPTYNQNIIEGFARVFTGWDRGPGFSETQATEVLGEVQAPPLGVHECLVGLLEALGHRHGLRRGVVDRRVAVGVRERLGERAGGQSLDLAQDLGEVDAAALLHLEHPNPM